MEGGVGEDRVDVAVELEVEQVADLELDPLIAADRLAGLGDHRRGRVRADHPALGKPLEQQLRRSAAAASSTVSSPRRSSRASTSFLLLHLGDAVVRNGVQSVTVKGSLVSAPRAGAASNASMAAADRSVIPMSSSPFRSRCLAHRLDHLEAHTAAVVDGLVVEVDPRGAPPRRSRRHSASSRITGSSPIFMQLP